MCWWASDTDFRSGPESNSGLCRVWWSLRWTWDHVGIHWKTWSCVWYDSSNASKLTLPWIHTTVISVLCWKNVHSSLTSIEVCCLCQITFANARGQILVYRMKSYSSIISFLLWVDIRLRMARKEFFCWGGSFLLKRLHLFLHLKKDEILN